MLLIDALSEMVRRNDSETGILFVGGSDSSRYEADLKQKVSDCGLSSRIFFLGQLPGIGAALDLAAVKVLTSHSEGLPRVLVESALAGRPSISTRVSGVDEVYGTLADRCVLRSRDPIELAKKLEDLLNQSHSEDLEFMRLHAEARFSPVAHLAAWRDFFKLH
jgi:glycosyltransferase involved in cell wall biosynthesis